MSFGKDLISIISGYTHTYNPHLQARFGMKTVFVRSQKHFFMLWKVLFYLVQEVFNRKHILHILLHFFDEDF